MTDGDDDDDDEDAETDANGGEAVCERERVVSGLWWRMLLRFRGTRGDGRCDRCSAISQGKNGNRLSCATHTSRRELHQGDGPRGLSELKVGDSS